MATVAAGKINLKRVRKNLTLKEKYDIIQKVQQHLPYRKLAKDYNCSIGQISNVVRNRAEIEKSFEDNINPKAKRLKGAPNHDINDAVWHWFQSVTAKSIPLSG